MNRRVLRGVRWRTVFSRVMLTILPAVLWTLGFSRTAEAGVAISYNFVEAVSSVNGFKQDVYQGKEIPAEHMVNAQNDHAFSRIQVSYSNLPDGADLSYDISQQRGQTGVSTNSFHVFAYIDTVFTVANDMTYELSGFYNATNAGAGKVHLDSVLMNNTTGDPLFWSRQESVNASSENFILGETNGNYYNALQPSPSGMLIAGNSYRWSSTALISGTQGRGLESVGNLTLRLTNVSSEVPEPASMLVWSLGTLGLAYAHRKRRQIELAGC